MHPPSPGESGSAEGALDPKPTTYLVGKLRCSEGRGMPEAEGSRDLQEEANVTVGTLSGNPAHPLTSCVILDTMTLLLSEPQFPHL